MLPITTPTSPPGATGPFAAGDRLGSCVVLEATADSLRWGIGQSACAVMTQRWPLLAAGFTPLVVSAAAWTANGAWTWLALIMGPLGLALLAAAVRPGPLEWTASRQGGLRIDRFGWLLRRQSRTFAWREVGRFNLVSRGLGVETSDGQTHLLVPAGSGEHDRTSVQQLAGALSTLLARGSTAASARAASAPARNRFKERKRAA